jgi:hypothetical protein
VKILNFISLIILLCSSISASNLSTRSTQSSEIITSIAIIRHGMRTPQGSPKVTNKFFFQSNTGELTINGFRQQQLLGQWIRERYMINNDLLDKVYNKDQIKINASPQHRCIFSSAGLLEGLYPGYKVKPKFSEDYNFENDSLPPIKNLKQNIDKDIVLDIGSNNNNYIFHANKCKFSKNSTEVISNSCKKTKIFESFTKKQMIDAMEDIKSQVPALFVDVNLDDSQSQAEINKNFNNIAEYTNVLYEHLEKKIRLKQSTWELIRASSILWFYEKILDDSKCKRIMSSPILDKIRDYSMEKITTPSKKDNLIVFSGHDTTIANLLSRILDPDYLMKAVKDAVKDKKLFDFICPPFSSSMFFEVRKDKKGTLFVRIIYNGEQIKKNLVKQLLYNEELGGFDLKHINEFLGDAIDLDYKKMDCNLD